MVRKGGQMKWKNQDIRLTETLWGQQIGLKTVTEGQWAVYFKHLELGLFDERLGRVLPCQTIETKACHTI